MSANQKTLLALAVMFNTQSCSSAV